MKIAIASDHAGYDFKEKIKTLVSHVDWIDVGPANTDRVDYPDYAVKACEAVTHGKAERGLLICGSGVGMSMAANKVKGIRAALVNEAVSARLCREHNDANVLCLGARLIAPELGAELLEIFMNTTFGAGRHEGRINKIMALD